jgi:hypothetical protein
MIVREMRATLTHFDIASKKVLQGEARVSMTWSMTDALCVTMEFDNGIKWTVGRDFFISPPLAPDVRTGGCQDVTSARSPDGRYIFLYLNPGGGASSRVCLDFAEVDEFVQETIDIVPLGDEFGVDPAGLDAELERILEEGVK